MAKDFQVAHAKTLLQGLALAVVALTVAGCGGKEEGPVTAASTNFQVADETSSPPTVPSASTPDAGSAAEVAAGRAAPEMPGTPSPAASEPSATTSTKAATEVPSPPTTPPIDASPGGANAYPVPEGKEALLAFLEKLQRQVPKGQTQQQLLDDYRSLHSARIEAANKLLTASQEKQVRLMATQAKLDAMRALTRLGDRQAEKELNGYSRTVMKDADPEIANLGRLILFGLSLDTLANGEMTDVQPLLVELKKLVAEQPNAPGVFMITGQAAMLLQQIGQKEAALDAYRTIGKAFKDSSDPQLATAAKSLLRQAQVIELDLEGKLQSMHQGQPGSAKLVFDVLKTLLGGESPSEDMLRLAASRVIPEMEFSGNYQEAGEAFTLLETTYKNHPDPELAKQAAGSAANYRRRSALIGQPFLVDGVQLDGSPFDWSKYQGKVVLVDFWATWCGPCLQEIPNIKKNYEKYREQGFEVVGVNLDDDPQTVQRFLGLQPLPWTTVVSADANARGFEHPLAVKCGIDAIPFIVLIGRDGKVNALHVRGEKLEPTLAQMLGPAAGAAPAPTPAAPAEKPPVSPPGTSGKE